MRKLISILTVAMLFGFCGTSFCQVMKVNEKTQRFRVMFYNTENLYDPFDDSLVQDDEFLPDGARHWTYSRFLQKLNKLAKVILAVGEWDPPALVGLCEVENRFVSGKLVRETPLKAFHYRVIHEESPDPRGVDVVLLYRESMVKLCDHKAIRVIFPEDSSQHTRDILYAKLLLGGADTLHVFVNHWPSKFGGIESSEKRRDVVMEVLRSKTDSLQRLPYPVHLLMMGDFNAEPDEECIHRLLRRNTAEGSVGSQGLANLTESLPKNEGTHKFQGIWSSIDQVIVSDNMLTDTAGLRVSKPGMMIFQADFLLEKDETNLGFRPFRTYMGPAYHGGFSDHLPVFLDLEENIGFDIKE